jgi:hypothetical protein
MDPLEIQYDSLDTVPEPFRPLYAEVDGKFQISHINGLKTTQDVSNVQEALRKEREDHAKVREALKPWNGMKHDEVMSKLDRIQELEAAAEGKLPEEKIQQMVEARLGQKIAPLERKLSEREELLQTTTQERDQYRTVLEKRDLSDAVRKIASEFKVVTTAVEDAILVAGQYFERLDDGTYIVKADSVGVTPGLDMKGFFKEQMKVRPHWFEASQGGGAGGGGGTPTNMDANPWSKQAWNKTDQTRIFQEQGKTVAENMAKAAGVDVFATRPK